MNTIFIRQLAFHFTKAATPGRICLCCCFVLRVKLADRWISLYRAPFDRPAFQANKQAIDAGYRHKFSLAESAWMLGGLNE
jgi:hypothetical protein